MRVCAHHTGGNGHQAFRTAYDTRSAECAAEVLEPAHLTVALFQPNPRKIEANLSISPADDFRGLLRVLILGGSSVSGYFKLSNAVLSLPGTQNAQRNDNVALLAWK